nr:hypothetical protein [uncultured Roseibium sp.]
MAVRFFSILCLLIGSFSASASFASGLIVEIFIVPEAVLCQEIGFRKCININQRNIDSVLSELRYSDDSTIEVEIPPKRVRMNLNTGRRSKLISLRSIYDKYYGGSDASDLSAAVFFIDLPLGETNVIEFRRRGGNGSIHKKEVTTGRYITWVNAADVYPRANAEYSFKISGEYYPFRFSLN